MKLGNQEVIHSERFDTVNVIPIENGIEKKLRVKNELYVAHVMYRLISISLAQKKGFRMNIDDNRDEAKLER